MKNGQPHVCVGIFAIRRAVLAVAVGLVALSLPAVAALEDFDRSDVILAAMPKLTEGPPPIAQTMLDADRREREYQRRAGNEALPPSIVATPAASQPASSLIDRARQTYQRIIVPGLSRETAIKTAEADKPAASPNAVVPPVRREAPVTPPAEQPAAPAAAPAPAAKPETPKAAETVKPDTDTTPPTLGVLDRVQDWLARSNREYQGIVVKGLSKPSSLPPPSDDAIARKIEEDKAAEVKKAQEDAAKKVAAEKAAADKVAADAAKKAEAGKKAADAKAREAKQIEDARKKAEDIRNLADEASRKADEILKLEAEKKSAATQPPPAPPQQSAEPKPDFAEQARREAQRLADEARRQEENRKAAEAARQAEVKAAEARAADERRRAAEAEQSKHRTRFVVLSPEPIERPRLRAMPERPERISGYRTTMVQDTAVHGSPVRQRFAIYQEGRGGRIRGTAVKRWIWRTHTWAARNCRFAGRRIKPPGRYTVARGDSLWRISEKHYNSGAKYPRIYRANRAQIADPDLIYPCQRFRVPKRR